MNISGIDLNLLLAFEALIDERNVGRAAKRVGLSQPAFSNAIGRLRARLGDSLFVRTAQGMMPTSQAERLAGRRHRTLLGDVATMNCALIDILSGFSPASVGKRSARIDHRVGIAK